MREDVEGESTDSSGPSSLDSSSSWGLSNGDEEEDVGVEDSEEVNQVGVPEQDPVIASPLVQAAKPIVPSSNSYAADDLDFPKVHPAAKNFFKHSFNQGGSWSYSSKEGEVAMAPRARALGKQKAMEDELMKLPANTFRLF